MGLVEELVGEVAVQGPVLGARARGREALRAQRTAREAAEAQAREEARLREEAKLEYVCPHPACGYKGKYALEDIHQHVELHRKLDAKAQAARDKREADRKKKKAARGHTTGNATRRFEARVRG